VSLQRFTVLNNGNGSPTLNNVAKFRPINVRIGGPGPY
jgi:hypothetical protein